MGNVLNNISKDNTRVTIFENDQVLTADQLNDLFNYIEVQTRLTRTRAIGVGIICGLEIGILDSKQIVVSKGAAITTDGDLLHFDADQQFDQYDTFDDVNAKYNYLRTAGGQVLPMYALYSSSAGASAGKDLAGFEETTGTFLKDHVGILYLEDYTSNPDVCTGTDCDNKGAEAAKELRTLLVHKDQVRLLLQSMPDVNKNYFALEDISVPRVNLRTTVDTYDELNAAFNDSLVIKEDIKSKLLKAYQVCSLMLEDQFGSADPTSNWNTLLDAHFNMAKTIYGQYVYDFVRDMSYAYNELRETLFGDNMMCCPDVDLFPKHVLMGLVKTAAISQQIDSPPSVTPLFVGGNIHLSTAMSTMLTGKIRFDIGALIRRFHPIHIDVEYRHHFYESPVLNNKDENVRQTRFCFMRIDAMIKNFKIPVMEELQALDQGLKITPSHFEDRLLGERSIPFYYKYDSNMPLNVYWNFKANIRKTENQIYSYFSDKYSNNPAVVTPLRYNILPYSFFRVEGHIGFNYKDVEQKLNAMIIENNLPINVMSVQIESNKATIPIKNWYFPELHLYEHFVRNAFIDQLDQVDIVHNSLKDSLDEKIRTSTSTEDIETYKLKKSNIEDSTNSYSIAKKAVLAHPLITQAGANEAVSFKSDIENLISQTNEVKRQTKEFAFSNTAMPHDFVINTDIGRKTDLFADFTGQKIDKKIQGFILANFIQKNPGLEHAGGVLRGGTFVLVYRSQDGVVVSDFMLPYASIDQDIVNDPPVPTVSAFPPRIIKKFDPKVIEIEPTYLKAFNSRIGLFDSKVALFDSRIAQVDSKVSGIDSKFIGMTSRVEGLDFKVGTIPAQSGGTGTTVDFNAKFNELNTKFTTYDSRFDEMNTKVNDVDTRTASQGVQIGQFNSQLNTYNGRLTDFDTKTSAFESRLSSQDNKFTDMDGKIGALDTRVKTVDTRVGTLDVKVSGIDTRVGGIDSKMLNLDTKVGGLDQRMVDLNVRAGTGGIIGVTPRIRP